jgi:hypothetical protein
MRTLASALLLLLAAHSAQAQEGDESEALGARATATRETFERARGVERVSRFAACDPRWRLLDA